MSYSTVNVGTTDDDGTGDTIRAAFTKVNTNYSQVPAWQGIYPSANLTGTNGASAQNVFSSPSQITLLASTLYEMDGEYHIDTTGANAHYISTLFAGTATYTSFTYTTAAGEVSGAGVTQWYAMRSTTPTVALQVIGSIAGASVNSIRVRGVIRVNAGGTIIPQFQYSAIPGAAPTIRANSFFRVCELGAASITSYGSGVS